MAMPARVKNLFIGIQDCTFMLDIHAHLDWKDFTDVSGVLERMRAAGVRGVIAAGINPESNRKVLDLAASHPTVYAALGLYPDEAQVMSDAEVDAEFRFIEAQAVAGKIVALSEVGLDFSEERSIIDVARQEAVFGRFLSLGAVTGLRSIVHTRKAEARVLEMIEGLVAEGRKATVVLHCFCGKKALVKKAMELGCYFSVPAIIARSEQFQALVSMVSSRQLLLESDAPFLGLDKRVPNEPSCVAGTLAVVAGIKGVTLGEMRRMIEMNEQAVLGMAMGRYQS